MVEGTPPGDAFPPPPQRATPARKGARCGAGAGCPRPHRPHPGHTGRGTPSARSRGRAAGGGTAPDTRRPSQRWQAIPPGDAPPPPPRHAAPTGHAGQGDSVGLPHPHTCAHSTWVADPNSPPQWAGSRGRDSAWPQTPLTMVEGSPPGDALPPPPQRAKPARKGARCGAGAGSPGPHPPHPGHTGRGTWLPAPEDGRPGEGQRLTPDTPRNDGRPPPRGRPSATPTTSNAPTHQRTSHGTSAANSLLLGTATRQWRNPRPHAKHAPNLRRWTQHTRSSWRWDSETAKETPHKGTRARTPNWRQYRSLPREARRRNLRRRWAACPPSAPRGNGATALAKAGAPNSTLSPAPMTERCPKWDPRPHAPPYATGWRRAGSWMRPHAAASISRRPSTESPTRERRQWPCTPGAAMADPQRGSLWNPREWCWSWRRTWSEGCPTHPVCGGRAHKWNIQVYTPPRAWPFSTWAVLAVMWHLAPEDAPTGTAEEIARDLHTWPADQDYAWRRPRGGLPVAPAAEGLSLAATLQRHPDKRARHFLQTGTVPAAPPDSEWRWDAGEAQPLPGPWVLPLWYLPMGTLAHATQAVKGAFPQPLLRGVALPAACRRGPPGYGGRKEAGARAPISPWSRARRCSTPRAWGPWNGGRSCPARRAGGSPRPPHSPCDRRRRATASYGWSPLWPPNTPLRGTYGGPY